MANESAQNTRTLNMPWLALVTRADPNWQRDHRRQVQDERRPNVLHDWTKDGPYEDS
jgi:hypothetical protein